MVNYMSDYKLKEKQAQPSGRALRRFFTLLFVLLAGLVVIYGAMTSPTQTAVVTDTAPAVGFDATTAAPNLTQSVVVDAAPVVNVEQAAPPPAAQPAVDNTAVLMVADTARDARAVADTALAATNALAPRVSALETAVASIPPTPDVQPTLVYFERQAGVQAAQINQLWGFLLAGLGVVTLLGLGLAGVWFRPPAHGRVTVVENRPNLLHGADTVQHGVDTVQNTTSGEPLLISDNKPNIPKRSDQLNEWQRAYIQIKFNRLKTYTAVSNDIWGYHGRNTLKCIKDVVG